MDKIFKNISLVFFITILIKVVAFVKEMVLAAYLGTGLNSDALYIIIGIQQILYPILSVSIWKVFLPEYKKRMTIFSIQNADNFANKIIIIFFLISIFIFGTIYFFSELIIFICAPGSSFETKLLASQLLKKSAPLYIFIVVSAIYAAILQCHEKFIIAQLRELFSYFPIIISCFLLNTKLGIEIIAYSLTIGSILRLVVQLPFLNWGYKFKIKKLTFDKDEKQFFLKIPYVLGIIFLEQSTIFIDKIMSSNFSLGAISIINYSQKILNLFDGLIVTSVVTVLYPQIIKYVSKKENKEISKIIFTSLYIIAFIVIPISLITVIYSEEIVRFIFQRGNFNETSTKIVSNVYKYYGIGLLFIGYKNLLNHLFYSCGYIKSILKINLLSCLLNILLNIFLSKNIGIVGIALSTSISNIIHVFISAFLLNKKFDFISKSLISEIAKIILAIVTSYYLTSNIMEFLDINNNFYKLLITTLLISIFYILLTLLVRSLIYKLIKKMRLLYFF